VVALHDVVGVDFRLNALAQHGGPGARKHGNAVKLPLSARLLKHTHDDVTEDDAGSEESIRDQPQTSEDAGDEEERDVYRACGVIEDDLAVGAGVFVLDGIAFAGAAPGTDLVIAQAGQAIRNAGSGRRCLSCSLGQPDYRPVSCLTK